MLFPDEWVMNGVYGGKFRIIVAGRNIERREKMESSPVSKNVTLKVDLCTPTENLNKQHEEVTPDNPIPPDTTSVLPLKKVPGIGSSQKLSKRKLFGQFVDDGSGYKNHSETVCKKKRSDNPIRSTAHDNTSGSDCATPPVTVKRQLTERQQLAFLLEVTSTREREEDDSVNTFTKLKSRKRIKTNGKSVNPHVYRRNNRGETPLHIAAIKGDEVALKKLIKDGAEVDMKDYAGWTALHEACNHGNLAAARILVKHGATVNVPGFEGDTPLHDAVVNDHVKVVNMLLACGADPHRTNKRSKKPIDLIRSKEMSDMFNIHGVQHQEFEHNNTSDFNGEALAIENVEKSPSDNERRVKSSILGNEFQRKETQGESKMEKPVMYICKMQPRNEELTIRTTRMTSYMESSNVEDGDSDVNNIPGELVGCTEPSRKLDASVSETSEVDKKNEEVKVRPSTEEENAKAQVEGNEAKDASSFESCDQLVTNESTKNKQPLTRPSSENPETGAEEAEILGMSFVDVQDEVDQISEAKLVGPSHGSEKLDEGSEPKKAQNRTESSEPKQGLNLKVDDDITTEPSSLSSASEDVSVLSLENKIPEKSQVSLYVQGKLTNEIAKATLSLPSPGSEKLVISTPQVKEATKKEQTLIPLSETFKTERTSGDLPEGFQRTRNAEDTNQLHVERSRTPEIDESIAVEVLATSLLSGFAKYDFSSVRQQDKISEIPSNIPRNVSSTDVNTTIHKDLAQQSNEEVFLDVEGFDLVRNENLPSAESGGLLKQDQSHDRQAVVQSSLEQDQLVTSTSNDDENSKDNFTSKGNKTKQQVTEYPRSMIISIPVKNRFPVVPERCHVEKQDTLDTSEFEARSTLGHTDLTSLNLDEPTSENNDRHGREMVQQGRGPASRERSVDNEGNLRYWQIDKKDKRGRKKVGLGNAVFTREGKTTKEQAATMEQPISKSNQDNIALMEMNTTGAQSNHGSLKGMSTSSLRVSTIAAKPSKPAVTWQSLMYAERCQLAQLAIPGYDEFLMKTKEYELAKDANVGKSMEEPVHSLLTNEKQKLSLKHEKSKKALLRKQRSEQDKLQLCMEQEIVRFYTKKAYCSLKCNQPPGVCTAINWQNMSTRQLQNEKKKCSENLQKLHLEQNQTSSMDHQEIEEKFDRLKRLMGIRHKHEQRTLDAVINRELQSCV